jgi:hypothetical protein
MTKRVNLAWLVLALASTGAAAQTGTVPLDSGTPPSGLTNSNITVSNGNVGIGTASPSTALDVNGGVSVEGNTLYLRSPGDSYHHIRYGTVGGISDADGIIFSSSFTLAHGPDGSETPRFVVQGAGNVGIGTTSPGAPLEVNGAAKVDNGLFVGNSSGDNAYTTPAPAGIVLGGGNQSGLSTYSSIGNGSTYGVLNYYGNISENYMRYFDIAAVASLGGMASRIRFLTQGYIVSGPVERMRITEGGNVGIGTTSPQYPLSVNGTIQAKEVLVNTGWSDYVFDPHYRIKPLPELAAYIKANHHLPDIPTETEVEKNGVSLGDMQSKLLAKIEELTLQMIQLDKKNKALEKRMAQIEGR